MWLFQSVYAFLCNSVLEFVFFILVDIVAKNPLREARTDYEKKSIWFYESLFLAGLSLVVYWLDHTPYLLLLLTFLTFIYTQVCGRVDVQYWWRQVKTRWEEHQHHTESVKMMHEQQKNVEMWRKLSEGLPVSKPVLSRLSDYMFKKAERKNAGVAPNFAMNSLNHPLTTQTIAVPPDSGIAHQLRRQELVTQASPPAQYPPVYTHQVPKPSPPQPTQVTPQPKPASTWFTRNELRRRPLRTSQTRDLSQTSFSGTSRNIRNRFMSAFGFSGASDKPVGLRNEGQNLCFMNCVIQCLARSPKLVQHLVNESKKDLECSVAESVMLSCLAELMSHCGQKSSSTGVLDPTAYREAVSVLNPSLVSAPTERQHQQDAAEYFMWLMESLHNILNKQSSSGTSEVIGPDDSLSTLKFIYGDLKPNKIEQLKAACRKEIGDANGLNNESYAEPIQRLSDLEWLTYKQNNRSAIDSLFTGQLVEAYHCLADNHLTVNTQTFSILPVPIVSPREVSGMVFLEDCFTKFCNIEHLNGQEGLVCSVCSKNSGMAHNQGTPLLPGQMVRKAQLTPQSHLRRNIASSVDSALHSPAGTMMSPIPGQPDGGNDSGFHDNVFRTSTPVGEQVRFNFPFQRLRDAQRRCLLRQLPECLVIQLLRFTYNQFSQQSRKINAPVSIPLKNLDLTSIVYDNVANREDLTAGQKSHKYDLYAVCVHLGAESTNCGHYICYCQGPDKIWYKFDDDLVWDVNMEYEITTREIRENAYLLFYKRAEETRN